MNVTAVKYMGVILLGCALLAATGCANTKGKKKGTGMNPLTALKTENLYTIPDDINKVEIRAGWVDVRQVGRGLSYRFSAGRLKPFDGTFAEYDDGKAKVHASTSSLVEEIAKYVVGTPVGLVLTLNGILPNADKDIEPPEEFVDFVLDFQTELERKGILYTFIIMRTFAQPQTARSTR